MCRIQLFELFYAVLVNEFRSLLITFAFKGSLGRGINTTVGFSRFAVAGSVAL